MPPAAVIFDLDGVLIDSEALSWRAWSEVMGRYDIEISDADIAALTGRTEAATYDALADRSSTVPAFEIFWEEIAEVMFRMFDRELQAFEDAQDTVEHLLGRRMPLAVGSSSPRDRLERAMVATGWTELFPITVAGDDVEHGKPEPDIFLRAADLLQVHPAGCLVVEDSPPGIEAARRAGMRVVAVDRGHFPSQELLHADVVVPRLTPAPFL